jgi:YidC/Oxa1 family membrane protein insertase
MKMDWLRTSLIAGIALVCFLLMIRWGEFQERNQPAISQTTVSDSTVESNGTSDVPNVSTSPAATDNQIPGMTNQAKTATAGWIRVETDVLEVLIDPHGGDIVKVALPTFYAKLNSPDMPFILLNHTDSHTYVARSGLVGPDGTDSKDARPLFDSIKRSYSLADGQEQLDVDLVYQQEPGVTITKRFTFSAGSHLIAVRYIINNGSQQPWQATLYGQIKRDSYDPNPSGGMGMKPFLGAATSTNEKNYLKLNFDDIADEALTHKKEGGWVAMVQHYFLSAWVPPQEAVNEFRMFKSKNADIYYFQFTSQPTRVEPGTQGELTAGFYAGPKDIKTLEKISPYLDLTVDYSFLWWIAKPLFYALDAIHGLVGNWGVAIILLTVCIKILFFYPSATSYRSMAKMRKVQPKMLELKERYGDDRQKFSAEMMKLYRTEKVNPFGGCLPILIQMPVFLALYWVLMESVELRQAPFFLWIEDLSVKDPYYVLPLIMGVTMWIQQKLNPTPPDPMQAKIMQIMPVMFTLLFLFFPAGLVLYWVVNNTLSITQQYIITRNIEKAG